MYTCWHFCRWCGAHYKGNNWTNRDGFCSSKHKQAHHRAYKKYVTEKLQPGRLAASHKVTQKKRKKRK